MPERTSPAVAAALAQVRELLAAVQDCHLELAHLMLRIEQRQQADDAMKFEHPA